MILFNILTDFVLCEKMLSHASLPIEVSLTKVASVKELALVKGVNVVGHQVFAGRREVAVLTRVRIGF